MVVAPSEELSSSLRPGCHHASAQSSEAQSGLVGSCRVIALKSERASPWPGLEIVRLARTPGAGPLHDQPGRPGPRGAEREATLGTRACRPSWRPRPFLLHHSSLGRLRISAPSTAIFHFNFIDSRIQPCPPSSTTLVNSTELDFSESLSHPTVPGVRWALTVGPKLTVPPPVASVHGWRPRILVTRGTGNPGWHGAIGA